MKEKEIVVEAKLLVLVLVVVVIEKMKTVARFRKLKCGTLRIDRTVYKA
jgi:hypothetical protein